MLLSQKLCLALAENEVQGYGVHGRSQGSWLIAEQN